MFRQLFSRKKPALAGTPATRRMKTYNAESGYVYQYFYEGYRVYSAAGDSGTEFVFTISGDRKTWHSIPVLVSDEAVRGWSSSHGRELSSTERYAVAKIALFHAFDERPSPAQMNNEVRVRRADLDGIIESLDL